MEIHKEQLESIIREILMQKMGGQGTCSSCQKSLSGVISIKLPQISVSEKDRMDTGKAGDIVYTKDLFTLAQSPRLGCGIMQMQHTTFDWTLNYDEIDYVIEGSLSILVQGETITANAGELILIPKGSKIQFHVPDFGRLRT